MGLAISQLKAVPLPAYDEPSVLTASIYARDTTPAKLLFKFRRTASRSGSRIEVLREYTYPDGKLAAREQVAYDGSSLLWYRLDELQTASSGTAAVQPDPHDPQKRVATFEYKKEPGARARARSEVVDAGVLVDDMVGNFISANFERVRSGAKVNCRYIVVSRKETVGLTLTSEGETTWHGQPAALLKLQPTSSLISILVDPLYFIVQKEAPHLVYQYIGRTTPKGGGGGHWKDLDAVTVFDWQPPQ